MRYQTRNNRSDRRNEFQSKRQRMSKYFDLRNLELTESRRYSIQSVNLFSLVKVSLFCKMKKRKQKNGKDVFFFA